MKSNFILSLSFCTAIGFAHAQFGTLDGDFDGDGLVSTVLGGTSRVEDIVIQPDGKIVVVGSYNNAPNWEVFIGRYLPDGSPDLNFGSAGQVFLDFDTQNAQDNRGKGIALQSDGKILIVGFAFIQTDLDVAVARLLPNGSLDNTFNGSGKRTIHIGQGDGQEEGTIIKQDANGKIVIGGYTNTANSSDFLVLRLNEDGTNDNSFNGNSQVITDFDGGIDLLYDLEILPDGRMVAVGKVDVNGLGDFGALMLMPDGSYDNNFSSDGKVFTDFNGGTDIATELVFTGDNKLILVGAVEPTGGGEFDFGLCKYSLTGALDLSFSGDGKQTYSLAPAAESDVCMSAVLQPDGKLIMVGYGTMSATYDFTLLRINTDGTPDNTFGSNGLVSTDLGGANDFLTCAVLQADLRLVVGGHGNGSNIQLARYMTGLNAGLLDFSIVDEVLVYPNPVTESMHIDFSLSESTPLEILLVNISGKRICTLLEGQDVLSGPQDFTFTMPADLKAGTYFVQMQTISGVKSIRIEVQ